MGNKLRYIIGPILFLVAFVAWIFYSLKLSATPGPIVIVFFVLIFSSLAGGFLILLSSFIGGRSYLKLGYFLALFASIILGLIGAIFIGLAGIGGGSSLEGIAAIIFSIPVALTSIWGLITIYKKKKDIEKDVGEERG